MADCESALADAGAASDRFVAPTSSEKIVALVGGSGRVGQKLRVALRGSVRSLRILDMAHPGPLERSEAWSRVDICDLAATTDALKGVDAIIHLAGFPGERPIEDIVRVNVLGTHNIYEAARRLGIPRLVLGSSNHVTGFFPRNHRVSPDGPMRPDSFYGLGKCFNELEAGLYFEKFGIKTLIIRIANATIDPEDERADERSRATWISPRDLAQLVLIGLENPNIDCTTVYGVSKTPYDWWDNSRATELGYDPLDSGGEFEESAPAEPSSGPNVAGNFQGGRFCAIDHDGALRCR